MGTQGGIGQTTWDDVAKTNFVNRTGKHQRLNVAELIEKLLIDEGLSGPEGTIPRSTLNRLLSGEPTRNRVGLTVQNSTLNFTHNPEAVLSALSQIAADLAAGHIVLGDIWNNQAKHRYLDRLDNEKVLPASSQLLSEPVQFRVTPNTPRAKVPRKRDPKTAPKTTNTSESRTTLIRSDLSYDITWRSETKRIQDIWRELQFYLDLDRHPNAVSVLLRVLLELSMEAYIEAAKVDNIQQQEKLSGRITKVAEHLAHRGIIDNNYRRELQKLTNSEKVISADTMNRYVHSPTFNPSKEHLCAIWDTISPFVTKCLNSK